MVKLHILIALCYFSLCCRGSAAIEGESYTGFYAKGLKLNAKLQAPGKMRAFYLSSMREPDQNNKCDAWDCVTQGLMALDTKARSGLFAYAVYHLAELAMSQNQFNEGLGLLAISTEVPQPLARKISLLKGRLLQFTAQPAVADHFRAHAEKFTDAESLYFAAAALERSGDKKKALELALRVLDKPEADFAFAQSGLIIRNLMGQAIYAMENVAQKIRLMEALRVAKDRASAQKLYQSLLRQKLAGAEKLLFTHYASRLAIDGGDLKTVTALVGGNAGDFLADGNDKAALDICERLLKKKQFNVAESLFSLKPPSKSRLQCRLRLAQRAGKLDIYARETASAYIAGFDGDSTLAERVFLRSCLPDSKSKQSTVSVPCLEELRNASRGKNVGAGARYYLARHYDAAGQADKVMELLAELAADYADDFYFYRILDKPFTNQKNLVPKLHQGASRSEKILAALVTGDLNQAKNVGELSELKDLEKRVWKMSGSLTGDKQTALLLFAADGRDEARELMRGEEGSTDLNTRKLQTYETLIALGRAANKSDIALYGVKQWMREKKLRPFLYDIPPGLLELLYPTTYGAHVEKYAEKNRIEVAEVMALIRQESQFFPGALSVAHAQGLMQLLPSTAKLVAAKEGMRTYDLFKAEDNIRLGTAFMRDIKDYYTADYVGLAIAYNAGPGRYTQWKKKLSHDDDFFIEEIPFQETYQYVRILLIDRAKYRVLLKK